MIELIDLNLWVDRLNLLCPSFESRFFQTLPADDLLIDRHQSPVGFIYVVDDQSDDNQLLTEVRQIMTSSVTIETLVRRTATRDDLFNSIDSDTLRQSRSEIFNALIGWLPNEATCAVIHKNSQLIKKEKNVLRWADTFYTDISISTL